MAKELHVFVFHLGDQQYGIPLSAVDRVIQAVEVSALAGAPPAVLGVINVHGAVMPVVDMWRKLEGVDHEIQPEDHIIIAQTRTRPVALLVGQAQGVLEVPEAHVTAAQEVLGGAQCPVQVARLHDGVIRIYDLGPLVASELEEAALGA